MNRWLKIEELINGFITSLMSLLGGKAKDLTPKKIKKNIENSKELLTSRRGELKEKLSKSKDKAIAKAIEAKGKIEKVKENSVTTIQKARETDIKKIRFAQIFAAISAFLAPPLIKLKTWYLNLQPTEIASFVTLSTVATLASVNIYVQSNKMAEESRSPASELVEEVEKATAVSRRPAYFKRKEKQFLVSNVILPAYIKKNGAVKKLVIDFTFESSNRYIKNFLWENSYYVHDVLNSTIEPISIDFPLEEEGKTIIKEKIQREINGLLKRFEIKGEIKEVYIHSMIAA